MKPVNLKFKGINSFSEQTEIDFESLTKNGIFGIFGDTGSGKSTILDCINFALYGKVERSKEKLDIINYRSESAEVAFEFYVLSDGKRRKYNVERSIKKKSGTHKAMLYEDGACIADNASTVTKKITEILGVDAEDFRKCIALPQGEFAQFVKSQPSERIKLIERLFSLYKYGDRLNARIKERENNAELEYNTVFAKLENFNDVTPELIKEFETRIIEGKSKRQELERSVKAAEKKFDELKALGEKKNALNAVEENLSKLESEKQKMNELRNGLKIAPLCKTAVETYAEISKKKEKLVKLGKELAEIVVSAEAANKKVTLLHSRLKQENLDEKIAERIAFDGKYQACANITDKLGKIKRELEVKRDEYRNKSKELERLEKRSANCEAEVEKAEKQLSQSDSKDFAQLINIDFKGALLKNEYVYSLDYFVELNGQVNLQKDSSPLFEFLSEELKNKIAEYKDKVCQVKDFSIENAQKQLKNYLADGEEREKLITNLNTKIVALKDAQSAVKECLREMQIIKRDGENLSAELNELRTNLKNVFGETPDYASVIKTNSVEIENLKRQKEKLQSDIESLNKQIADLSSERAAKFTERKAVEEDVERLNGELDEALRQTGFKVIEDCKTLAEEFSKFKDAEKALEEYDSKLISYTARKKELECVDGIKSFTDAALNAAEIEKRSFENEINAVRENLAVCESEIVKSKLRLEQKKSLQKELSAAEKTRNLISQLKELTKGNKFMEYLANEYLYDISSLASAMLLNLTDGRYFLTYTDNFYAGDNFNCGNLRGVNTLSGGETFLVSLSLALALSQTICSSLKSIEFFFLDEGFGTLDSSLVDTVMNALEKLKSSNFTIGVISHVEELKHRIVNKITVNKATESRGSAVCVSC